MKEISFSENISRIDTSGIRKIFEAAGSNAINLGLGQPDFDTPEHIKAAAIKAINEGFTGYTVGPGIPELREALSQKFREENGFSVSPQEIIVTSGASEALTIALTALLNIGDEVMISNPGFVSYNALTEILNGKVVSIPLAEDLTMKPDAVLERITPKTKALILNSPSNPTGAVSSRADVKALAEIADDHNITIISDEVYEYFIYEGEHVSPASYSDNVVTVNATSKSYSMTGWRLGYLAARKEYIAQMNKVHQYIQACANSIAQKAAYAAVTGPKDSVNAMREEFRKRRDVLVKGLNELGMECALPKGAFYAFPKVESSAEIASKMISNGVVVVPGTAFGSEGDGYIRISYAASMKDIEKSLEIMEKVL
ncbi:Biosynthetic Aromatic amino acid aminotransferase alpha / Aspartate aminotransferase [Methanosarcina siciliae T4/M]|uniref:Biosynthetic Aromatic amino acid aminotransferase alpha / Aspartate aminotransferase n=2 Tax=Methanosarcina siciliae TaxID=38027 RepID=A0A0E3PDL5_9EURY|nr:pyridoxal phosphate-dependent aminotransferase [Methanosarcina siciliae]AKB28398.1 Biosynthetic Aromatic amino acid aminotransferase alpha / Aspartate aminotransferase [Methanosarcina siciliae T4/M]AKB32257.1 Biosynthetic Aromatic amino acid aminotransferase alpha / Aspartate aminotransferase [Methanosarcina siciliae HI350]